MLRFFLFFKEQVLIMRNQITTKPSILRKAAALLYDSFIIFSFLMMMTALALWANRGQSLSQFGWAYQAYLVVTASFFLGWFWLNGGQTLGMLAWRVQLRTIDNQLLTWRQVLLRLLFALFLNSLAGLGWLWSIFDKDNQALYDKLLKFRILYQSSPLKKKVG